MIKSILLQYVMNSLIENSLLQLRAVQKACSMDSVVVNCKLCIFLCEAKNIPPKQAVKKLCLDWL